MEVKFLMWGFSVQMSQKRCQNREGFRQGVYVDEIEADSPAMEAGIQCGDVITSVNGESVSRISFIIIS